MELTTAPCPCPVVPSLDELTAPELAKIIGAPLRCVSCGEELELCCPKGHVHQAPRTRSPNARPVRKELRPEQARGAGRQVCVCGNTRAQHTSPYRAFECAGFEPKNKPHVPKTNRTYNPKRCACGVTFTPTGPRATRCPECRSRAGGRHRDALP